MPARRHRMLVVTQEGRLQSLIRRALEQHEFHLLCAADDHEAQALLEQKDPELIVLDLDMQQIDGYEICRSIRQSSAVPILALMETETVSARVKAFDLGVDDCLTKPFAVEEFLARVNALLRRAAWRLPSSEEGTLNCGTTVIDLREHRLMRAGKDVHLTRIEWALLEKLIRHAGKTLTHRMLLQHVWGDSYTTESEYLRVYTGRLRRKIEDDPASPRYLLTEPGIGYRFVIPESISALATPAPSALLSRHDTARRTTLPAPLTSFIGRVRESAAIRELLQRANVRLLTLTGAPGTGKTRLALHVAATLLDTFDHGVFFVALASINDPNLVLSTVAHTLGIKDNNRQISVEHLKDYLYDKHMLLVLDNFEQLLEAGPLLVDMLAAAPGLKVLATSRVALHLSGEHEYPVEPLALPNLHPLPSVEELAQYEAVALFTTRMQAIKPNFTLTTENATAIAQICVQLDGLPLAIELAAVRAKQFDPEAMVARLDQRLTLLTTGPRDLSDRHRTLRATFDWSYELLDAGAQALLARLGVFVGGCTMAAAEAVCNETGDLPLEMQEGVAILLDNNLLQSAQGIDGESRVTMLETVREYALERLAQRGEIELLRQRHATYYLALAETAEPALKGAQQQVWFGRLEQEHDNLRAALRWALERAALETAARLGGALWFFWYAHGHVNDWRKWLEQLLEAGVVHALHLPAPVRAQALMGAATFAFYQADHAQARALAEASLALSREIGDKLRIARALNLLGSVTCTQGDYMRATVLLEEQLALRRESGNKAGIAPALGNLAIVFLYQGDLACARQFITESLSLYQELEDKNGTAYALNVLGSIALHQGDHGQAIALFEESLALSREMGNTNIMAITLSNQGYVALEQDDPERATILCQEGLAMYQELGDKEGIAQCLERLAGAAGMLRRPVRATRLFGAAEILRANIAAPLAIPDRRAYERQLAHARAQIDEAGWAAGWAEGRAMSLESAIDYALDASDDLLQKERNAPPT